jgi:hypothetical protein
MNSTAFMLASVSDQCGASMPRMDVSGTFGSSVNEASARGMATEEHAESLACASEGAYAQSIAFLSTAAPRRGTLPDFAQQPSPKLFH